MSVRVTTRSSYSYSTARQRTLLPARSDIDYEIVVIDDNSPDGTQAVVRQLQRALGEDRCVFVGPPCRLRMLHPAL